MAVFSRLFQMEHPRGDIILSPCLMLKSSTHNLKPTDGFTPGKRTIAVVCHDEIREALEAAAAVIQRDCDCSLIPQCQSCANISRAAVIAFLEKMPNIIKQPPTSVEGVTYERRQIVCPAYLLAAIKETDDAE